MAVIVANHTGIIIVVLAFAIAFGVGNVFGLQDEGPLMMIAGPLTALFDIAYGLARRDGHLFVTNRGGKFVLFATVVFRCPLAGVGRYLHSWAITPEMRHLIHAIRTHHGLRLDSRQFRRRDSEAPEIGE